MKKSIYYLIFGVVAVGLFAFVKVENPPKESFSDSFSQMLTHAKEYTLDVAKGMPAEEYTFKPSDSVKTFGEQMAHIGMSTQMILNVFIKGEEMNMDPTEGKKMEQKIGASKEECIKIIESSFDNVIEALKGMDDKELQSKFVFFFAPDKPEFTKKEGFGFIRDHVTHHRAQAIVYLRVKGQVPPSYRAF